LEEFDLEKKLRPLSFDVFAGQDQIIGKFEGFVEAKQPKGMPCDHTPFSWASGLGENYLGKYLWPMSCKVGIKNNVGAQH
jgi:Holliday junction DNA helicase RuvB